MKIKRGSALTAMAAVAFAACTPAATTAPVSGPPASVAPSTAASGSTGSAQPPASPSAAAATVRLQLQWTPQAQFAGYFAADKQGYFAAENLTVNIVPGGPDVIPQVEGSKADGPEFTISWVPKVLEAREGGSDLVDIAQIFQRSGTLSVTWKDTGLDEPCKLAGKKVGVWDFGNEYEVTAGLLSCGLTPGLENGGDATKQYQKVIQAFDMKAFLAREIDAAEAMIYNEYAQVLETTDAATGELYKPEQLTVLNWNDFRVAMLQDAIFVRKAWLESGANRDIAVRFVRASLKGWIYCRDHADDCVQYATDAGSLLGTGHQKWMMNEVNALVWPSPIGVGMIDPVFWQQTVKISKNTGIIKGDPSIDAYTSDIVKEALAGITDDTKGEGFTKGTVEVTAGGK
ncbi:MAG TPA: ABC transporter substrate-binding protein [Patescibacteria group bacterium]|nr:ABC transporter substrate-binding protein [Patescibacteria group bacterium]